MNPESLYIFICRFHSVVGEHIILVVQVFRCAHVMNIQIIQVKYPLKPPKATGSEFRSSLVPVWLRWVTSADPQLVNCPATIYMNVKDHRTFLTYPRITQLSHPLRSSVFQGLRGFKLNQPNSGRHRLRRPQPLRSRATVCTSPAGHCWSALLGHCWVWESLRFATTLAVSWWFNGGLIGFYGMYSLQFHEIWQAGKSMNDSLRVQQEFISYQLCIFQTAMFDETGGYQPWQDPAWSIRAKTLRQKSRLGSVIFKVHVNWGMAFGYGSKWSTPNSWMVFLPWSEICGSKRYHNFEPKPFNDSPSEVIYENGWRPPGSKRMPRKAMAMAWLNGYQVTHLWNGHI